jgi:hypothetical protein
MMFSEKILDVCHSIFGFIFSPFLHCARHVCVCMFLWRTFWTFPTVFFLAEPCRMFFSWRHRRGFILKQLHFAGYGTLFLNEFQETIMFFRFLLLHDDKSTCRILYRSILFSDNWFSLEKYLLFIFFLYKRRMTNKKIQIRNKQRFSFVSLPFIPISKAEVKNILLTFMLLMHCCILLSCLGLPEGRSVKIETRSSHETSNPNIKCTKQKTKM